MEFSMLRRIEMQYRIDFFGGGFHQGRVHVDFDDSPTGQDFVHVAP
jgi:hypothetical protein